MRIVIIGGYGVFGGRLAQLLLRDSQEVWIAGRDLKKARAFTLLHGGTPLELDLGRDLSPIRTAEPNIVVDAAGPFQAYGEEGYQVARFCLDIGINYLDLSDDAQFTSGIAQLDQMAKSTGCFALSGVSSVPAISSSVVAMMRDGLSDIQLIETVILPGNRAPRGRSVMGSILMQAGAPMRLWRGGMWREASGWSQSKIYSLDRETRRRASLIGAPDLFLFPEHFKARSVIFRAGLELSMMQRALEILAWARKCGVLGTLVTYLVPLHWLARQLELFGTDRGGMIVEVTGNNRKAIERRRWTLIAEAGDGPFIPATPARAVIRNFADIPPGARPFLNELPLRIIEDSMSDLSVASKSSRKRAPSLFQNALGLKWPKLPPAIRRLHSVQDIESFSGRADITRGSGFIARFAAWFFRFPEAGKNVPVVVTMSRTDEGEVWERDFAGRTFRSYLTPSKPNHCKERFWALTFEQELPVENESLHFLVRRGWFLGIPLPRWILPGSDSREFEADGVFNFDVGLSVPFGGGLIVRYQGQLTPDA